MKKTLTLSSKGQITVPLEVRTRLGVKPGDKVEFVCEGDLTVLRPAARTDDPFAKYVGCLPAFSSIEESTAWVREMRDPDKEYM